MDEVEFARTVAEVKPILFRAIADTLDPRHADGFDDVVQESLLRAWSSLRKGGFRGDAKFSTWLYVIGRNEATRMNRRRAAEARRKAELHEGIPAGEATSRAWNWPRHLLRPEENDLIDRVSAGQKEKEIAVALGVARGTIKSRLSRLKDRIARGWTAKTEGGLG